MRKDLTLKPIGWIQSPYKQKFGTPRQGGLVPEAKGKIILDPDFCPPGSLDGLEEFSHVWVLFHFHKNSNETVSGKVRPPRLDGEKIGLFATRTPHRPNPIGMSAFKIETVNKEALEIGISGVDVVDHTPIFDIKPYHPEVDFITNTKAGWIENIPKVSNKVKWSHEAISSIESQNLSKQYQELVTASLKHDLRDLETKNKNQQNSFASYIGDYDVHFVYDGKIVEITKIIPLDNEQES